MKGRLVVFAPGLTEVGGAARRAGLLLSGLAEQGWEVKVLTRAGTLRRFKRSRQSNMTVVEVPGFSARVPGLVLFLICAIFFGIVWGVRASVFIGFQLFSQALVAATLGTILRRPFLLFGTISGIDSEITYNMEAPFARLRTRLLRRAAFMVAQTDEMASEMGRVIDSDRIRVVPNPVRPVDAPELTGERRALYAGRLSYYKDLPRLLEAWREIAQEHGDATLTLCGEGGDYLSVETELRATVEGDRILRDSVRFTGWVPDIAPFLADTDVFVLPSTAEGMSNSLVEACAWSRVVVASDIAANRSVLGDDYPLLFEVGDTASLVEALRAAFGDEELRAQAVKQIDNRIKEHSSDRIVGRIEGLLGQALGRSERHHTGENR